MVTPASNTVKASAAEEWFFGNDSSTAFIDQIRRVEPIRLQTQFADAVRGLYTYGVKTHLSGRLWKSAATVSGMAA